MAIDIVTLASQYGRYGYRRITALLRCAGWNVNRKWVERIWRREGLKVPQKQPKRGRLWFNDGSCVRLRPEHRNHVWVYDFVADRTHDGKAFRMLTVIDDIEDVIFAMFFVLAGLHFNLAVMKTAGMLALLVVAGRFCGKYLGTRAGATIARSSEPVKKYLGLALMPKAGVTIGLALIAQNAFPAFGELIFNGILASVIINELFAPPLVKYAISRAGEQMAE